MLMTCSICKGKGYHEAVLRDLGGRGDGCGVRHIVPCDQPGCKNGIVDTEVYYRDFRFVATDFPVH